MRSISFVIFLALASASAGAQSGAETTPLISEASQFVSGAGADASNLIDGDASTVWHSTGSSFTVRLPQGLTNGTPFRIRFTVPAGASDVPAGFAVYGMHEDNGVFKSETAFGYTNEKLSYDGRLEYESPTFYVRDEFRDQYWYCTHLRFDCTETCSETSDIFSLAEFQIVLYNEYTVGDGAMLRNDGDISNAAENHDVGNSWYKPLVDEVGTSYWKASDNEWIWQGHRTGIIVTPQPVSEATHYILKIGRPSLDYPNGFPTDMLWSYQSEPGGDWTEGGHLDLHDVAAGEIRDVEFILLPEYYRLKFETISNVGNECIASWAGGKPNTVLSRFQLYGPVRVYAPVPDPLPSLGVQYPNPNKVSLNQDFFKNRLYSKVLSDFRFEHTHGIVDKRFDNNFHTDGGWLGNLDIWDSDGHLLPGFEVPGAERGVALPDFSYDAKVNSSEVRPEGSDFKRQPTTTIFHEVLVIPGERVDLIPYSDIWHRSNYLEDFYRFYDYMSDKAHPDVYFLFNPRMGAYSDDGLFGGRALGYVFNDRNYGTFDWNDNPPSLRGPGGVASFYRPRIGENDEYIDEYIAADYSQHYYTDGTLDSDSRVGDVRRFLDVDNKVIHEPIVNFRHVFHVVDGRKFADESSKDSKTNEKFLAEALNLFYAPADKEFKIRLINPMPKDDGVHSNRYYRKNDGTYARMGTYEVQTYRYDGYKRGERIENMFVPDERSVFRTVNTNLVTELNPDGETTKEWVAPDAEFYRALKCEAANAKEGTYLIRLVAKTPEGERIYLDGGDPEGMSLRDIIITFLDKDHASFELEKDIPYEHSEKFLDENFQTKSSVDFDKYMALSGNEFFMEKSKNGEGERIKYPVPWLNSEYAFGYRYHQDYSAYTIASHTSCVPYAQAAAAGSKWDCHDRLYKNTDGEQQGFFYYANAAGDPGVMARVDIPSVCIGSTIHVSAWINSMGVYMDDDYENNEPANVNFDLVATMKDGREVNINNFSTGYVPNDPEHCGKWMHTYYSVTPDFSIIDNGNFRIADVEKFQVVLVNNSINSNGADYAIDDIRIYVSKPVVMASQLEPLCQGDDAVSQRLDMPFRNLVNSLGGTVAKGDEPGEDVTVFYAIFDKDKYEMLMEKCGGFTQEVFDGSILPNLSNGGDSRWGAMTFNTNYENNIPWEKDLKENIASRYTVDGIDCISFNVVLEDGGLYAGKHYIASLCVPGGNDFPEWTDFDISDACTRQSEFKITGSTVIKIDGVVMASAPDLEICENQFPVVQVDIYGIEASTGDVKLIERTPLIDWYKGSLEAFAAEEYEGILLDEALLNFRHIYPDATTTDCEFASAGAFRYDESYKRAIEHFIEEGSLVFASYSFLSDAARIPQGETSTEYSIVIIPANRQEARELDGHNYMICNDPAELRVKVDMRAPGLLNGFENVDYPDTMKDVPLRAGLGQLDDELHMPMRSLYIVTPGVNGLKAAADNSIYLVKTNDPEFRNLEIEPGADEMGSGLRPVGEVIALAASKDAPEKSNASVRFDDSGFKEGYYYTVRFDYTEDSTPGTPSQAVCDGQAIFTVKVVAEYQMWTGNADGSSNFNNDKNWRRVSSDELLSSDIDGRLVSDGENDCEFSYSPLGFTKVIIPAGLKYPWLFAPSRSRTYTAYDGRTYIEAAFAEGLSDNANAGAATTDIHYDLIATGTDGQLYCRFWDANTCGEIHFKPNSEIANQQHLLYEKAWVDMEMEPGRWYTASSPLQSIVAGDMYLPSAGARQNTELFRPMTFAKGINDRFNPAVYQRGWDKGTANVFELPSASPAEVRNAAISLDWSDVYNDVCERYSGGCGFSVKTDISGLKTEKPAQVLFRLPKDDSAYEYWTQDGLDHGAENGSAIERKNAGRLNPVDFEIQLTNSSAGKYFLVGNPFMAHLDMARFFEANKNVLNPKYWIMTGDSQQCAVMSPGSGGFVGTDDSPAMVAPMQGFFVEAKENTNAIDLRFTSGMIAIKPWTEDSGNILRIKSRNSSADGLSITASSSDGRIISKAILSVSPLSDAGYRENEDVLLLASYHTGIPQLYTVAGNKATSINVTPKAEGTEIGLTHGGKAEDVTLRFENTSCVEGLYLVDRKTGYSAPICEGLEYTASGEIAGRLYIASRDRESLSGTYCIIIKATGNEVSAISAGGMQVDLCIYDLTGKCVAKAGSDNGPAIASGLAKGFYIAEASDANGTRTVEKVYLR